MSVSAERFVSLPIVVLFFQGQHDFIPGENVLTNTVVSARALMMTGDVDAEAT